MMPRRCLGGTDGWSMVRCIACHPVALTFVLLFLDVKKDV